MNLATSVSLLQGELGHVATGRVLMVPEYPEAQVVQILQNRQGGDVAFLGRLLVHLVGVELGAAVTLVQLHEELCGVAQVASLEKGG